MAARKPKSLTPVRRTLPDLQGVEAPERETASVSEQKINQYRKRRYQALHAETEAANKRRAAGKATARERIEMLVDDGSFALESNPMSGSPNPDQNLVLPLARLDAIFGPVDPDMGSLRTADHLDLVCFTIDDESEPHGHPPRFGPDGPPESTTTGGVPGGITLARFPVVRSRQPRLQGPPHALPTVHGRESVPRSGDPRPSSSRGDPFGSPVA